jgi:HAD superfamily hydrolase (TIGR01509 family)
LLKAVIFDMDGVIIDSEPMHGRAAILTLKKYKVDITFEYLNQFIGSTTAHMCKKIIEEFHMDITPQELMNEDMKMKQFLLKAEGHMVIPYVIDLIKNLHTNNVKLMIASSSPPSAIEEVMETLHIKDYFTGYVSGAQVAYPKPAPDIFLEAAKRLQIKPEECVVIEDSANGVNAAFLAGMTCIGFVNPNSGNQDLSKAAILVEGFDEVDYAFISQVYQHAHLEPATIITTDRLVIRELSLEDIPDLYQMYQNPENREYIDDISDSLQLEKEKHLAYIQNIYHFYNYGLWGVFLKEKQQLIGRCGVEFKMIEGNEEYELGYLIDKSFQGLGYAKECAEAVIAYTFQEIKASCIVAVIDNHNYKSIRLAESLGLKPYGKCNRAHRECILYKITVSESRIQKK